MHRLHKDGLRLFFIKTPKDAELTYEPLIEGSLFPQNNLHFHHIAYLYTILIACRCEGCKE